MQKRLGISTLVAILTSFCAPALVGRQTRQPQWSENLSVYGYSAHHPCSDTAVVASNDNVAVALNLSQDINATPSMPAAFLASNWKLSLLVFGLCALVLPTHSVTHALRIGAGRSMVTIGD